MKLSNILLRIEDQDLTNEYYMKKSKEVLNTSAAISGFQIFTNIIIAIVWIVFNWHEYILELWLGRIIGIVLNILLVIFLYKYPIKMVPLMAGLIEINHLCFLLWNTDHDKNNMPQNSMPASIAGLAIAAFYGLLTNANWMLTTISNFIVVAITLTYYSLMFNYVDVLTITIVANSLIFVGIALYK